MVGDRYGQSLDIGKEIEKEKEEEKQPLPCVCSPDLRKKDQPAGQDNAENKEEKSEARQDSEKTAQPEEGQEQEPSQEQEAQQEQAEAQSQPEMQEQQAQEQPIENQEQQEPPEEEMPPELPVPDPVEEDVNAIITKEIPELPSRTSFWTNKWLLGIVFVALIAGIFLVWMKLVPENAQALPQQTLFEPVSLVVYNTSGPAAAPAEPAQAIPPEQAEPETIPGQQEKPAEPKSIDELSEFLSEQLKD